MQGYDGFGNEKAGNYGTGTVVIPDQTRAQELRNESQKSQLKAYTEQHKADVDEAKSEHEVAKVEAALRAQVLINRDNNLYDFKKADSKYIFLLLLKCAMPCRPWAVTRKWSPPLPIYFIAFESYTAVQAV